MRWRLVGGRPFFTDFISGVFVMAFLFGGIVAIIGLVARPSWWHTERWTAVGVTAVLGAAMQFLLGWLPSSVRLHSDHLRYRGTIRGGTYNFSECSSIRCDRYNGILRLSLDMSPEAGWAPQTIVFAAPVKRINEILFLLDASGKLRDSACLQS